MPRFDWMATAVGVGATMLVHAAAGGAAAEPKASDAPFIAAVGVSTDRDALKAAEQATRSMLAKFRARGRRAEAVVFLERTHPRPAAEGRAIGDRVKELAGAATYGTGGQAGVVGVTWWAKQDHEPTFLVLGMGGAGLRVTAHAAGGAIPADAAGAEDRAAAMGGRVRPPPAGGLALLLGGVPRETWTPYLGALRDAVPAEVPLLGPTGWAGDYVYADGRKLTDDGGKATPVGQLLLVIEGNLTVAMAGATSRNTGDAGAVLGEADAAASHAVKMLGDRKAELVLAFSDPGRLRTSGLNAPGKELAALRGPPGKEATIFGCFTPVQMGVDNKGRVSIGEARLMLAAIADGRGDE